MPTHTPSDVSALPLDTCTPPAPAASSRRPGAILPGSNGSLWIAQPRKKGTAEKASTGACSSQGAAAAPEQEQPSGAEQWALYLATGQQESLYWTHDNGGRPFMVRVTPQIFAVYKNPARATCDGCPSKAKSEEQEDDRSDEHVVGPGFLLPSDDSSNDPRQYVELVAGCGSYLRLWAGEDETVSYEFGLGNSLLVQLSDLQYMYIGEQIATFEVEAGESIERYESPIGNNDVPYPYAVGTKNSYLMIERVYIPSALRLLEHSDPYRQYYDSNTSNWQYNMKMTPASTRQC